MNRFKQLWRLCLTTILFHMFGPTYAIVYCLVLVWQNSISHCLDTAGIPPSIPAVSAWRGTLPSGCFIYIRRETDGKPLASCKLVTDFSLETRYLVSLFLILQNDDDDKDGRISANGVSGCTVHYTEKRNDIGEFCTLVRELWGLRL